MEDLSKDSQNIPMKVRERQQNQAFQSHYRSVKNGLKLGNIFLIKEKTY